MVVEFLDRQPVLTAAPTREVFVVGEEKEIGLQPPDGWSIDAEIINDPRLIPIVAAGYVPIVPSIDNDSPNATAARIYMEEFERPPKIELTPEQIESEDQQYIESVLENTPFPDYDKWDFSIAYARHALMERREQKRKHERHLAEIMIVHKPIFLWKAGSPLEGDELMPALPETAPKEILVPETNHRVPVKETPAKNQQTFGNTLLNLREAMVKWVHAPNGKNGIVHPAITELPQIEEVGQVPLLNRILKF